MKRIVFLVITLSAAVFAHVIKEFMIQGVKRFTLVCMLFLPLAVLAQTQYFLPTTDPSVDEKERPMIEVYLPKQEMANGCAVVLCPGGAMRWLSWESDVVKMASFLNEQGIAAIGLRYHLSKEQMPQGVKMPPMVDVTHPETFPQADANPMHTTYGDSIIQLAALDAKAAIRLVREHADEWHISKDKIGFLGDHPNVAAGLVALFMEWKKAGANAELHIYGDGKGPYELMPQMGETTTETWSSQMVHWLKAKGFMNKN